MGIVILSVNVPSGTTYLTFLNKNLEEVSTASSDILREDGSKDLEILPRFAPAFL